MVATTAVTSKTPPPVQQPCPDASALPQGDNPDGSLTKADLERLPRRERINDIAAPAATPPEAAADADAVFVGTVQSLDFSLDGIAVADVVIDKVVKGNLRGGESLPVELGFVFGVNADCTGGSLWVDPGSPVLPPGQQAVFMADLYPKPVGAWPAGLWDASTYAQAYPITGDTVSAEPTSPYGKLVHDVPVADFLDSLH